MVYLPVSLLLFLLLLFLLPFLWIAITLEIVEIAVAKLGFSPNMAVLIFVAMLVGSTINIPLYRIESVKPIVPDVRDLWLQQFWGIPLHKVRQKTVVALNVGGGLIPVLLAIYEFTRSNPMAILGVTVIVTVVSYFSAQIVPGIGIQMDALISPLTATISAVLIAEPIAPSIAFAGGILGTLIGADLLHLREIQRMSAGVLSIGGAGVFDGIAMCGLFALLLT
ncbi:MAG: DUF1614 domain-containing protein [Cyanobacteria bacterium]|jgi:uncharacterized membrane protein|nr:DUF1614 domain-containing protein [Cyanobacteria bacterium GSL.Bin21]